MIELLKNRSSIRSYTSEPIDETLLDELLEATIRTSTTGNMQLYSIVITKDENVKRELSPLHFNQPMIMQAPVVLTFCADYNRFAKWCTLRDADAGCGNFQAFTTAAIDALLVSQTFCIAAESKGLGICYIGTTTYTAKAIAEVLDLPKFVVPVATVTVGYPASVPQQVERLPLEAVLHQDKYTDYGDEDILQIYERKEMLDVNQQFVKDNNKENLAQVFAEVRYTKVNFEHFSKEWLEAIQGQGFNI
ncbi:MAG: nitroreductase family protein [Bacteroidales bacterium]|nr:nitroreductase family protein [Bacteroidales bacterium]